MLRFLLVRVPWLRKPTPRETLREQQGRTAPQHIQSTCWGVRGANG
ncbi:MAG: hypothetical protein J7647_21925 [Cyanobacteria bacterium SBLK]|nr:hypothetical protein [Cyanobacteria bacterium SBLK]